MERGNLRLLVLVIFVIFYLAIGAVTFCIIEGPYEHRVILNLRQKRNAFLANNPCVSDHDLEELIREVVVARDQGISPLANVTTPSWEFGGAFFFVGTVVTTIGYGNIAPLSRGGKLFCIVYAMFGIPMTAIMSTAMVERLLLAAESIQEFMSRSCAVRGVPAGYLRIVHLLFIIFVVIGFAMFVPAVVFMQLQGWDYFEAFYFCFISLTTIGLGDFVPGDNPYWQRSGYRSLYKVCCVFFFIVGIAFVILILELCAKIPDDHPDMLFSCHQPFIKDEETESISAADLHRKSDQVWRAVIPSGTRNTYNRIASESPDSNGNRSRRHESVT